MREEGTKKVCGWGNQPQRIFSAFLKIQFHYNKTFSILADVGYCVCGGFVLIFGFHYDLEDSNTTVHFITFG